jgi:hypothetical protein
VPSYTEVFAIAKATPKWVHVDAVTGAMLKIHFSLNVELKRGLYCNIQHLIQIVSSNI